MGKDEYIQNIQSEMLDDEITDDEIADTEAYDQQKSRTTISVIKMIDSQEKNIVIDDDEDDDENVSEDGDGYKDYEL